MRSLRIAPALVTALAFVLAAAPQAFGQVIAVYGTTAASNAGATYTVGTITGTTVQFDDGAGISGSGTLTNNGQINFNQTSGNTLTISNTIAGTGTLTLMNTGTLQLTGTAAGALLPLNMTINANSGALIGPATSGTQFGTFQLGKAGTGMLNVAGGIVTAGTSWQAGVGSGTGTINVSSGTFAPLGSLILGGTGGGSGTLTVTGGLVGTLSTAAGGALGAGIKLGASGSSSGVLTITNGAVATIGNSFIGELGSGTASVGSAGFFRTNQLWVGSGTAAVGLLEVGTSGTADMRSSLVIGGTGGGGRGTLTVNGGLIASRSGSLGVGAGALGTATITSGTWLNNNNGTTGEAAGTLVVGGSGTGSLTIENGGYVVVSGSLGKGTNGTITLNQGGTLQIGGTNGNSDATRYVVASTGAIGSGTAGVLGIDLNFDGTLKFAQNKSSATHAKTLSGSGDLVKTGTGTLELSGTNTYTGGTTLVAGAILLGGTSAIGTTGTITFSGGALQYGPNTGTTANGNAIDYSPRFSNEPSQRYQIDTNGQTNVVLGADLTSSGGSFTKLGSGTATLAGNNTFTSGSAALGVLQGSATNLATSGTFGVASGAEVRFNQTAPNETWAGAMAGSGTFSKYGGGTLTLTSLATSSTAGTLLVSEGAVKGTTNNITRNVVNNSQLTFDQTTSGTYSRTISGTGNVLLLNSGTITWSGTNTFTGTTTVAGGRLIGTTSSIQGAVVNNSAVQFNQSTSGTYAGNMSGSGPLVKNSDGTLTLTGSNSYQGGTFVNAGSLIGDTGSLQGSIAVSSGTLAFDQATSGTFSGLLVGTSTSSRFVKTGVGDLTLSGTNTNDGTWTVSSGTLIGTSLSLRGNITNNAAVVFDQAVGGTNSSAISGSGTLTKTGVGTLTLTGSNSYSGGTTVSAGELIGSTTSLQGSIANNAAVTFDQATAGTYAGVMSGNGSLKKTGAGTVTLTNASTFTGATTVDAGTLAIAGSGAITSSPTITIKSGATLDVAAASGGWQLASGQTLGGDGTLAGAATALAGAIVAPGEGIGTLTATGGFTLLGTLAIEISGTAIDLLDSSAGALSIGSGTVNFTELLAPVGNLVFAKYLSLSGGSFASVIGLPTGYTIDYTYLGNQIALVPSTPPGPGGVPEIDPAGLGSVIALVAGALGLAERRRTARRAAGRG